MTDDEIDKISQASFPSANTAFEAKYWDQMEGMLGSEKKSGFIYWWGITALVVILSGTFAWNYVYLSNDQDILGITGVSDKTSPINESIKQVEEHIDFNTTIPKQENKITNKESVFKTEITEDVLDLTSFKNIYSNAHNTSFDSLKNGLSTNESGINEKKNVVNMDKLASNINASTPFSENAMKENGNIENDNSKNKQAIALASMVSVSENSNSPQNQFNAKPMKKQNESEGMTLSSVNQSASLITGQINDFKENKEGEANNTNPSKKEIGKELKILEEPELDGLSEGSVGNLENTLDEEFVNEEDIIETEFGEKVPDGKKWKFFVEPLVGYGQLQSTKSLVSESVNSTSLVSPSSIKDWNIGMDVGLQYGNFFVKTGIRFQELNQNFNVKNTTSEISDEYQYNERPDGSRVDIIGSDYLIIKVPDGSNGFNLKGFNSLKYDTVLLTVTDTLLIQNKVDQESQGSFRYKIQYMNIPFLVGYEFQLKEKWLIEISAGVHTGIRIKQTGSTFDYSNNEVVKLNETSFASNYTFAMSIGGGVGYLLNPSFSLRLIPSYKYFLKTPFEIPERQRHALGIDVGLRFKF